MPDCLDILGRRQIFISSLWGLGLNPIACLLSSLLKQKGWQFKHLKWSVQHGTHNFFCKKTLKWDQFSPLGASFRGSVITDSRLHFLYISFLKKICSITVIVQPEQFIMLCSSAITCSGDTAPQLFKADWKHVDIKNVKVQIQKTSHCNWNLQWWNNERKFCKSPVGFRKTTWLFSNSGWGVIRRQLLSWEHF